MNEKQDGQAVRDETSAIKVTVSTEDGGLRHRVRAVCIGSLRAPHEAEFVGSFDVVESSRGARGIIVSPASPGIFEELLVGEPEREQFVRSTGRDGSTWNRVPYPIELSHEARMSGQVARVDFRFRCPRPECRVDAGKTEQNLADLALKLVDAGVTELLISALCN